MLEIDPRWTHGIVERDVVVEADARKRGVAKRGAVERRTRCELGSLEVTSVEPRLGKIDGVAEPRPVEVRLLEHRLVPPDALRESSGEESRRLVERRAREIHLVAKPRFRELRAALERRSLQVQRLPDRDVADLREQLIEEVDTRRNFSNPVMQNSYRGRLAAFVRRLTDWSSESPSVKNGERTLPFETLNVSGKPMAPGESGNDVELSGTTPHDVVQIELIDSNGTTVRSKELIVDNSAFDSVFSDLDTGSYRVVVSSTTSPHSPPSARDSIELNVEVRETETLPQFKIEFQDE